MNENTDNLLEEIKKAFKVAYISDLRSCAVKLDKESIDEIMAIPKEKYSAEDWGAVASYIRNENAKTLTVEEYKEIVVKNEK